MRYKILFITILSVWAPEVVTQAQDRSIPASMESFPRPASTPLNQDCVKLFERLEIGFRLEYRNCESAIVASGAMKNPILIPYHSMTFYKSKDGQVENFVHIHGVDHSINDGSPSCKGDTLTYTDQLNSKFVLSFERDRLEWLEYDSSTGVATKGRCEKAFRYTVDSHEVI